MLKLNQLGRVLRLQAAMDQFRGEPGMAVPRDRLPASWYAEQRQREAAHRAAAPETSPTAQLNTLGGTKPTPFPAMRASRKVASRQPGK